MKGHVRQRSKGSWEIAIDVGRDPATGKRLQHWETVRGTKRDAERRLAGLAVEVEKRTYVRLAHNLTLADYLTDWLQTHAELHCRPRTAEGYRFIVDRHLIPVLGRIQLSELRPQHISSYCSNAVRWRLSN